MARFSKLAVVALAATTVLALSASGATASPITADPTSTRLIADDLVFTDANETATVICDVSLGAELQGSIENSAGARVGTVSEGDVLSCSENEAVILGETLPWLVHLAAAVELPVGPSSSANLEVIGAAFEVEVLNGAANCLYLSTEESPVVVTGRLDGASQLTLLTVLTEHEIPVFRRSGPFGFLCPSQGLLEGEFALEPPVTLE